jgi:Tfp pilus assembly protein PilZ
VSVGDTVELSLRIRNVERTLDLAGEVRWKRLKEINLPGRRIKAGIGVEFDETSVELLKLHFKELFTELSDISDNMTGGNYIRVRADIAEKYNIDRKKVVDWSEKRASPRITITIPVEIFIQNMTKRYSTVDISLHGMCLSTDEKFPVGEEVLVVFEDKALHRQFLIKAVTLRNVPDKEDSAGEYAVGLKFIFEDDRQKKELMKFIIKRS